MMGGKGECETKPIIPGKLMSQGLAGCQSWPYTHDCDQF